MVDCADHDELMLRDLGAAAAFYLETTLKRGERSSAFRRGARRCWRWSMPCRRVASPHRRSSGTDFRRRRQSRRQRRTPMISTTRLAALLRGESMFLPAPGVVSSADALPVLLNDPFVREAMALFDHMTLALVGIGALGTVQTARQQRQCFLQPRIGHAAGSEAPSETSVLRFFDAQGKPVLTPLNDRVIGMRRRATGQGQTFRRHRRRPSEIYSIRGMLGRPPGQCADHGSFFPPRD